MSFKIFIILLNSINLIPNIIFCENIQANSILTNNVTIEPRIVGGYRPAEHTLAKYIVSIRQRSEKKEEFGYKHFCSGTIIEANKILTAAHCVMSYGKVISPSYFKIVAKTPKRLVKSPHTQEINVKKIICHKKFSDSTLFNDIAVMILVEDIRLDSKWADKIQLPKQNIQPEKMCTVIGWGQLYMYGPLANELLYGNLYLHSRKYCRQKLPRISSKKICASNLDDLEVDACLGDSGGPLICDDVVTGIVSYGYGCALGHAGVYTNVYKFLDWIEHSKGYSLKPLTQFLVLNLFMSVYLN